MPKTVNVREAKSLLSRLIDEVSEGQEIIIAKRGTPVARLIAISKPVAPRRPGLLKGQLRVSKDF